MEELKDKAIHWRLQKWFPDLSEKTHAQLSFYHTELIKFNKRINLISPRSETDADDIHFADAILGGTLILEDCDANEIYDLGSGNGIPGLVMAILAPERKFYLVDSDQRKIEFLKLMITRMSLKNVGTINSQVEDLEDGTIVCAVSRGFANLSKSLVVARRVLASKAVYYHFKGDGWFREIADVPIQVMAHFNPSHLGEYKLPASGAKLSIVRADKFKD